jgi:recombination protein RecR
MARFAEPMSRLIDELRKLPGIGTKSAQRLAFHVLRASDADARALAAAVLELREKLRLCSVCNNITDVDPCGYCTSAVRDQHVVCVIEEPTNIATIEKTRSYNGPVAEENGVGERGVREVILATSPTTEGEATAAYLAGEIRRIAPGMRVTRIATGVPAGSDIEYADEVTMTRAMEGRREF